jgi:RHS repeat-associated protein
VAVELIASLIRSLPVVFAAFAEDVGTKYYRYTGKERDDNSGLCYYGARYLAPWLARWISPDSAGAVDDLNLYVYVDNFINFLCFSDLYLARIASGSFLGLVCASILQPSFIKF